MGMLGIRTASPSKGPVKIVASITFSLFFFYGKSRAVGDTGKRKRAEESQEQRENRLASQEKLPNKKIVPRNHKNNVKTS